MAAWIEAWQRRAACLWMICRLVAALGLVSIGGRVTHGVDGRDWRAIEEFRSSVAPLVLFALMRLLAD